MILETRTRKFAVDLDLTGAKLECAVHEVQRPAGECRGQERAEVERTVADDLPRDDDLRERLVRELQVRIGFIVLKEDVKSRLEFFYEVRFENESLDLVINDDELEVGNEPDQLPRLRIVIAARLKV